MRAITLPLSLLLAVMFVGCTDLGDEEICQEAARHVAACLGAEPDTAASGCDVERAASLLDLGCDQVADAVASGKADGWWGYFACSLGFSQSCGQPAAAVPVVVRVLVVGAFMNPKPYVRAEISGPETNHTTFTDSHGRFSLTLRSGVFQCDVIENLQLATFEIGVPAVSGATEAYYDVTLTLPW